MENVTLALHRSIEFLHELGTKKKKRKYLDAGIHLLVLVQTRLHSDSSVSQSLCSVSPTLSLGLSLVSPLLPSSTQTDHAVSSLSSRSASLAPFPTQRC
jgi:hypothetical protein